MNRLNFDSFASHARIRKEGSRPKRRRFLIICEGEKTEPLYFEGLKKYLPRNMIEKVDVKGIGQNTLNLIKKTENLIDDSEVPYYHVWIVFDKDDFPDEHFNKTIERINAKEKQQPYWHAGWTNEAFELWYLYHFRDISGGSIARAKYSDILNEEFKKNEIQIKYRKNLENMFDILRFYTKQAIERAKRGYKTQEEKRISPSEMNPATTIHVLVAELLSYMDTTVYER